MHRFTPCLLSSIDYISPWFVFCGHSHYLVVFISCVGLLSHSVSYLPLLVPPCPGCRLVTLFWPQQNSTHAWNSGNFSINCISCTNEALDTSFLLLPISRRFEYKFLLFLDFLFQWPLLVDWDRVTRIPPPPPPPPPDRVLLSSFW